MYQQFAYRSVAVGVVAALLAACGTAAPAPGVPAPSMKKLSAAKAKAPTVKIIEADTVVSVQPDAATMNLEFDVRQEGATRSLMGVDPAAAIAADIANVEFTVTGPALAAPLTAIVPRAKFLNGKAVIQFNNLPAGAITISAIAKNAAGGKVVEANGSGAIKVGELTKVKLTCVVPPATGVGHVRIEMDCFSDDCRPKPVALPTSFVPEPIVDVKFHSIGDPHEDGANGLVFENQLVGTFLALRTLTNDLTIVKSQAKDPTGRWPGATVNNAIAVKSNGDVLRWYMTGRKIDLNGEKITPKAGQKLTAKGGMVITFASVGAGQAVADLVTPQGDKLRIDDRQIYMNLTGTVGADRVVHEVRGELGTFNNGTPKQGMLMRDGSQAASVAAFLEDWRVRADEDLLKGGAPVAGPEPKDDDLIAID